MDATEEENEIMGRHAVYWQGLMAQGNVLIFGPVAPSSGAWGLGVVTAEQERELPRHRRCRPSDHLGLVHL